MKERPILMTPENAQKCHDGTKTQTRRIVKIQDAYGPCAIDEISRQRCRYGVVGDRLWVREPFTVANEGREDQSVIYKGDPMFSGMTVYDWKWTPSIHMPRWACRTVLEITEVRVERLQDISWGDAKTEGSYLDRCPCQRMQRGRDKSPIDIAFTQTWCREHGQEFKDLWESINGKGSWDLNPWVWVISFKKVRTE